MDLCLVVLIAALSLVPVCSADQNVDWLVAAPAQVTSVVEQDNTLTLSNGLISRVFTMAPAFGTIDYIINATTDRGGEQSMLRNIHPEGTVVLDGIAYSIGGLGQVSTFLAYCNRSDLVLTVDVNAFGFRSYSVSAPTAPFPWTPGTRGSPKELSWPPKGKHLAVEFAPPSSAPAQHGNVTVTMHYEMYDGVPLLSKWMTVSVSSGSAPVAIQSTVVELFGANGYFGPYVSHGSIPPGAANNGAPWQSGVAPSPLFFAKTGLAHGAQCDWMDDYPNSFDPSGLKDEGAVEPYLNCSYGQGPGVHVNENQPFISFRVLELISDSVDIERQSLGRHRVTQTLAPHTTENPIFFHATNISNKGFKLAIDQMADVGFEMLIFSFGSGFVLETADPIYLKHIREQVDYAKSKGIEVGGYDLICLDRGHGGYGGNVGDQWDVVDSDGHLTADACFASGWYDKLHSLAINFLNFTGMSMLETDGPFGGAKCFSKNHTHHMGFEDSVYWQTRKQGEFYNEMRRLNVYVNQPDDYFFQGGSRTGMGYDESQYSLPRWKDISISRMGMYDDLYIHLPTQGWMFVPIIDYHGGGGAASFAPLSEHLQEYEWALAQYLGAGVAACYRGNILYDTNATRDVVSKWVTFYKAHRQTLIQPIIHLRRPTMQSWDGWLHVNPYGYGSSGGMEVGVALIFNPTDFSLNVSIALPLYYTGLTDKVLLSVNDGPFDSYVLDRGYNALMSLSMPPRSIHTVVVHRV